MNTIPMSHSPDEDGVGFTKDKGAKSYGCFSSRVENTLLMPPLPVVLSTGKGEAIDMVMAPVL
jgi:hypothetical protein